MNFSYRDLIGRLAAAGGLLLCAAPLAAGSVLYVDDDAEAGGDGQSWETAFRFLQDALDAAQPPGVPGAGGGVEEIHVAQGLYLPDRDEENPEGTGDRMATFALIDGVSLMGGYAGLGAPDPDARDIDLYETILSGDLLGDDETGFVNIEENSYHVVTADSVGEEALLEGFIVTAGNTEYDPSGDLGGGGLLVEAADLVVRDCRFFSNSDDPNDYEVEGGGGVSARSGAHVLIDQCEFSENRAIGGASGGGMASGNSDVIVTDSLFESNLTGRRGGGFYGNNSSVVVAGCTFHRNEAGIVPGCGAGGAVYLRSGNGDITDCHFLDNKTRESAAALCSCYGPVTVTDCIFTQHDWGISVIGASDLSCSSRFVRCVFTQNTTQSIRMVRSSPVFVDCCFVSNDDLAVWVWQSEPTFIGCSFLGNMGGAIYAYEPGTLLTLINCLFSGNEANAGGALYLKESGAAFLSNCSFTNNSADAGGAIYLSPTGGPTSLSAANCILWGNEGGEIYVGEGCEASVRYSCIQAIWEGPGNIKVDPLFVNPKGPDGVPGTEDDDLRLSAGSPCIDAAENFAVPNDEYDLDEDGDTDEPVPVDLDGNPRFVNDPCTEDTGSGEPPIVDMGAYEFQPPCPCDLDCDGDVDTADLLYLLGAWGTPDGDVDGDGDTDTADLLALLAAWGDCP